MEKCTIPYFRAFVLIYNLFSKIFSFSLTRSHCNFNINDWFAWSVTLEDHKWTWWWIRHRHNKWTWCATSINAISSSISSRGGCCYYFYYFLLLRQGITIKSIYVHIQGSGQWPVDKVGAYMRCDDIPEPSWGSNIGQRANEFEEKCAKLLP